MESFESVLKKPRDYDATVTQSNSGLPWSPDPNPGVNASENGNGLPLMPQAVNLGVSSVSTVPAIWCYPGFPSAMPRLPGSAFGVSAGPCDSAEVLVSLPRNYVCVFQIFVRCILHVGIVKILTWRTFINHKNNNNKHNIIRMYYHTKSTKDSI